MSMFSDMLFEEYEMLDEGKQADEYRARKAKEQGANRKKAMNRVTRYSSARIADHGEENTNKHMEYAARKASNSSPKFKKEFEDAARDEGSTEKSRKTLTKAIYASDAMDRHGRRHKNSPKTESAIMLIEAYECDYIY